MSRVAVKGSYATRDDAVTAAKRITRIYGKKTHVVQRGPIANGKRPFVIEVEYDKRYTE